MPENQQKSVVVVEGSVPGLRHVNVADAASPQIPTWTAVEDDGRNTFEKVSANDSALPGYKYVYGISGGGGGPTPLASANFVTGEYTDGGEPVTLQDLMVGDVYDPGEGVPIADLIEVGGLNPRVPGSDAAAIGSLLDAMAAVGGATVVMEWTYVDTSATILFLDEAATFGDHGPDVYYTGTQFRVTRNLGEVEITSAGQDGIVVGRNRVAFTYTPTETSFSLNGQAVVTSSTPISQPTIDKATVGSVDGGNEVNSHIRLIEVYEPQPSASLVAMSAL